MRTVPVVNGQFIKTLLKDNTTGQFIHQRITLNKLERTSQNGEDAPD